MPIGGEVRQLLVVTECTDHINSHMKRLKQKFKLQKVGTLMGYLHNTMHELLNCTNTLSKEVMKRVNELSMTEAEKKKKIIDSFDYIKLFAHLVQRKVKIQQTL